MSTGVARDEDLDDIDLDALTGATHFDRGSSCLLFLQQWMREARREHRSRMEKSCQVG